RSHESLYTDGRTRLELREVLADARAKPLAYPVLDAAAGVQVAGPDLMRQAKLDRVVWSMNQILLCAQVAFCGLHGCVAKKQLNLLKLATACAAQLCAGTSQVMWRNARDAGGLSIRFD